MLLENVNIENTWLQSWRRSQWGLEIVVIGTVKVFKSLNGYNTVTKRQGRSQKLFWEGFEIFLYE